MPESLAGYAGAGPVGEQRFPAGLAGYGGGAGVRPAGGWRPPAVLTDYDDTAAVQNVAELLLGEFGAPDWQEVRERFRNG